jgi:hypothetical protein
MKKWTLLILALLLLPTAAFAGNDELSFTGIVESRPDGTFLGAWLIGGETFEVTANTEIDESEGTLTVGACAELDYEIIGGSNVALDLKHDDGCDGNDDANELQGLVEARPTDSFIGTWTIGGVDFSVTQATEIEHDEGVLEVGVCAEVEYDIVDGVNVAINLKADDDCGGDDDEAEVEGLIESFPADLIGSWVIDGMSYEVTADTVLMQLNGPFAVGACVEVEFDPATNIASKVKTDDNCFGDDADDNDLFVKLYGTVEAFPSGLIGDWTVSGVVYSADANTQFKQEDGDFAVGACVEVNYLPDTLQAIEIETADDYHCGANGGGGHNGDDVKRYGLIESFPAVLTGDWVIDGVSYTAGNGTEFKQEQGVFAVGACVEIKYLPDTFVALEIETEDAEHCGGDGENQGSFASVTGNLDAFPETIAGTWTVDGSDYLVDETTILKENDGAFAVGVCVEVKFQTTNNLAVEIETEDAFKCGDSTTPSADDAPSLNVNHTNGASGSNFVLSGNNFAPDSQVKIKVNGSTVATALTNSDGWVTFAVRDSSNAGRAAFASISIEVAGTTSNAQQLTTNASAPLRNLPAGYSARVVNASGIPLAVGLSSVSATMTVTPLVMMVALLSLVVGTAEIVRRRA